jgi:hypothetical protein
MVGKPPEVLSFQSGRHGVLGYLKLADALPLRDDVPPLPGTVVA